MGAECSGADLWQWRLWASRLVEDCIQEAEGRLELHQELDWLLLAVADLDRLALRLGSVPQRPQVVLQRSLEELSSLWQQRLQQRVPIQYLLGKTDWRDFRLTVGPGVLIPRPETELLIDLAQAAIAEREISPSAPMQWADLGTGSGAIALGLARSFPQTVVHAVDCSTDALKIARTNAKILNLTDRVRFYQGRWFEPLANWRDRLDGIVSNPPYIPSEMVPTLQPEVAHHEPHLALDGGADGLDAIRIIVSQAPQYLKSGGTLLLEMMFGQADAVVGLLQQEGCYQHIQIHADWAGIQRFAQATRV